MSLLALMPNNGTINAQRTTKETGALNKGASRCLWVPFMHTPQVRASKFLAATLNAYGQYGCSHLTP